LRYQGKLTNWNDDKGFGFVEPNGGGDRAFVHIKSFEKRSKRPVEGDIITYKQVQESPGKYKATNINFALARHRKAKQPASSGKLGSIFTIAFCIALPVLVFFELLPIEVLFLYLIASVIAFIIYAVDKSAAQNNRWRTSEDTLLLLGLVGGWPGALYAQNLLRHKSSKEEFQDMFWISVALNVCVLLFLLTETGSLILSSFLG